MEEDRRRRLEMDALMEMTMRSLMDEVAALRREVTLLTEWGRRVLARADSLPAGRYPTSAEVRAAAGLPID